jgi:hypothetical protein
MIEQEFWAMLCVYQAIRDLISYAASAGLDPGRIGFKRASEAARDSATRAALSPYRTDPRPHSPRWPADPARQPAAHRPVRTAPAPANAADPTATDAATTTTPRSVPSATHHRPAPDHANRATIGH